MSEKLRVAILSASPKPTRESASDTLSHIAEGVLRGETMETQIIRVRESLVKKQTTGAFAAMAAADVLIVIFPLYVFCLPGILMRFLQGYRAYAAALPARKQAKVYAVVNCGFPEPGINEEAVRVIGRFSEAVGARFRFGVMIGGGGMVGISVPPVKKMLRAFGGAVGDMKRDILSGGSEPARNVQLRMRVPRWFYFFMGNMGWRMQIRRNGKKKKDLYATPYLP